MCKPGPRLTSGLTTSSDGGSRWEDDELQYGRCRHQQRRQFTSQHATADACFPYVERYSDKYHSSEQTDTQLDWTPDLKRFPRELRVLVRKPHRDGVTVSRSVAPCDQKKKRVKEKEEVLLTLEVK
ncbi:hypothetical protein F2P81_025370 [Scophthalmus maximus]|uniref:Uncharacterized protein n=1 Tax=Scophthalmus maximus TaxID=52904 RepID=A0A6A4RKI9_SCOMX|nr:hypothetical protein F2P81_025370 [Scophthalmus maximus]